MENVKIDKNALTRFWLQRRNVTLASAVLQQSGNIDNTSNQWEGATFDLLQNPKHWVNCTKFDTVDFVCKMTPIPTTDLSPSHDKHIGWSTVVRYHRTDVATHMVSYLRYVSPRSSCREFDTVCCQCCTICDSLCPAFQGHSNRHRYLQLPVSVP